jgi:hypothetical protein
MALDLSDEALSERIDALRTTFLGYAQTVRNRNVAYLRAFSPQFDDQLSEHDQWPDKPKAKDTGHTRSSFQIARPVVELWTSLEASEYPMIRWWDQFIPTPVPSLDQIENAQRQETYRADKLVSRQIATLREEGVRRHVRRSRLKEHHYRATLKKNIYGHSWLKMTPDEERQSFRVNSAIDPATVYPVWSAWDSDKLDAILVAYQKSARTVDAQFPGSVKVDRTGVGFEFSGYYQPSRGTDPTNDPNLVWVEDYWLVDAEYAEGEDEVEDPDRGIVVNAIRVDGKIQQVTRYPGWRRVPYFLYENEDERDHLGFSDVGTVLPIQDGINRFLSQQQDVIQGESRPRFKYRGDADRTINLKDEEVVSLDQDEDIEQIAVRLDVFPTQVHGQQLMEILARSTGLNDSVWGRIVASQNSGRALATAWRSVAARMVPRINRASQTIVEQVSFMLDCMELYDWDSAREIYAGSRDFEPDFPNQEPRDFQEVTLDAINRYQAGFIDQIKGMELTGEESPDEMQERVRNDYMDPVMHPEKAQAYLLLERLKQQLAIEAQQAGLQAAAAAQQLAQLANSAPGGAPSGASSAGPVDRQAAAATQAQAQAQAEGAPTLAEGQNAPAAQPGAPNGGAQPTKVSTMLQNGKIGNRIINQGVMPG